MQTDNKIIFCEYSKTLRKMPENYCLAGLQTFGQGGSLDAAVKDPESIFKDLAKSDSRREVLEELWSAVENGMIDEKFFELREKVREVL